MIIAPSMEVILCPLTLHNKSTFLMIPYNQGRFTLKHPISTDYLELLVNVSLYPDKLTSNYVIDESHSCGKGASAVISYIHHFLDNYGLGENDLVLHADNCASQNKNSFMIWYLLWCCVTNRHRSIFLNFLTLEKHRPYL